MRLPAINSPAQKVSSTTSNTNDNKQIVLNDIRAKWAKFSGRELFSLKNKDDLVTQLVAKYGLDKATALRDAIP